jgi:putative phosphoribosyl transferase
MPRTSPGRPKGREEADTREVVIPPLGLGGSPRVPRGALALVTFAHGSGSSRFSPRNKIVAEGLNQSGMATLLFDPLTTEEESDRAKVFDIMLLAGRLVDAVRWLDRDSKFHQMAFGLFGASAGAAAALVAAVRLGRRMGVALSRGGRPDLAEPVLDRVEAPTLLIVGGADFGVIQLNERALAKLRGPKALEIVPGASHLFPQLGALETVVDRARRWFELYLGMNASAATPA